MRPSTERCGIPAKGSLTIGLLFAPLLVPIVLVAQGPEPVSLAEPDRTAEVQFTQVTSVRELLDGTLLVADRREKRLVHVTWESGGESVIGRIGEGPGEYRGIGPLVPMSGDSTLFIDGYNSRWNFMEGPTIVDTRGQNRPLNRLLGPGISGGDRYGNLLAVRGHDIDRPNAHSIAMADTLLVIIANMFSERVDTIRRFKGVGDEGFTRFSRGGMTHIVSSNPLASMGQALLFPDGWIAFARLDPYRVEWRRPEGDWIEGEPIPYEVRRADDREKCAAMEAWGGPFSPCDPSLLPGWPEEVPPFPSPGFDLKVLLPAPGGELVVARTQTADSEGNLYDVVDRAGELKRRLRLPENQRLIGFGKESVYTLTTDEFDLQTITRHPWPG